MNIAPSDDQQDQPPEPRAQEAGAFLARDPPHLVERVAGGLGDAEPAQSARTIPMISPATFPVSGSV